MLSPPRTPVNGGGWMLEPGGMGNLAGIVLCGGRSARMGTPKAWLDFGGETLLERTVRVVATATAPVIVVAAPGQDLPALPAGVMVVRDPIAGRGPLQGIAAGLSAIAEHAPAAFVSATDAPFLHASLIRRLAVLLGDHEAVVPRQGGHLHALSAIYGVSARAPIAALLAEGTLRLSSLFERARALVADEALLLAGAELAAADPVLRSLRNVNTPAEYAAALAEAGLCSTIAR
jgi:molybdopterin-guanine dinucleotide biosynthesis protein A